MLQQFSVQQLSHVSGKRKSFSGYRFHKIAQESSVQNKKRKKAPWSAPFQDLTFPDRTRPFALNVCLPGDPRGWRTARERREYSKPSEAPAGRGSDASSRSTDPSSSVPEGVVGMRRRKPSVVSAPPRVVEAQIRRSPGSVGNRLVPWFVAKSLGGWLAGHLDPLVSKTPGSEIS